jgi:hypothetical protein
LVVLRSVVAPMKGLRGERQSTGKAACSDL